MSGLVKNVSDADLEKMREKLEVVCDLDNLSDCHAMLAVMMKNLKNARQEIAGLERKARELALEVLAGDSSAEDIARRIVRPSGDDSVVETAVNIAAEQKRAAGLTDDELISEAIEMVMAERGMFLKGIVVEEMAKRLKGGKDE